MQSGTHHLLHERFLTGGIITPSVLLQLCRLPEFLPGTQPTAATMDISGARVRQPPPVSRVPVASSRLSDLTGSDIKTAEVTRPDFASTQLHRTVIEKTVARMLPVE